MATTASRATVAAPVETVWEALASFADISPLVAHRRPAACRPPGRRPGSPTRPGRALGAARDHEDEGAGVRIGYRIEGLPAVVTVGPATPGSSRPRTRARTSRRPARSRPRAAAVVARLVAGRVGRANELVADLAAHVTRRPA